MQWKLEQEKKKEFKVEVGGKDVYSRCLLTKTHDTIFGLVHKTRRDYEELNPGDKTVERNVFTKGNAIFKWEYMCVHDHFTQLLF